MKEIIVKIKYDEKLQYLNESIIKENLCEYPGCGIIDVNEIKPYFPTDDEIKILTRIDAENREVLNYDGHDLIMKKGIEYGLSLAFGNKILKNFEFGKLKFEDLYVGMKLNDIDLGSTPQSFEIVEINYIEKKIGVKNHNGYDEWGYGFIKYALGIDNEN